jgi:formylmethanofuran dehydrogenase subunit C
MNKGRIEAFGNASDNLGHHMEGGEIEIHGCAGDEVGRAMKGGRITIHGDVGDYLGGYKEVESLFPGPFIVPWINPLLWAWDLGKGASDAVWTPPPEPQYTGEIIVMGNAGEAVGENMDGGTIRIHGEYKSLGRNIKGNIYHGDKLVFGKGV